MHGLHSLATRVRKDDPSALGELRHELEIQMVRIVRRVLRTGNADSALTRQILAEAGPATGALDCPAEERQRRVAQLARRLCDSVLGGLQADTGENPRLPTTVHG